MRLHFVFFAPLAPPTEAAAAVWWNFWKNEETTTFLVCCRGCRVDELGAIVFELDFFRAIVRYSCPWNGSC